MYPQSLLSRVLTSIFTMQVINIVALRSANGAGGFFPEGLNGAINGTSRSIGSVAYLNAKPPTKKPIVRKPIAKKRTPKRSTAKKGKKHLGKKQTAKKPYSKRS